MSDYFKAKLYMDPSGITVLFREFVTVHETPCYAYCIDKDFDGFLLKPIFLGHEIGLPLLRKLKERNVRVHRIHKTSSRFAFATKTAAFNHLVMLKRLQINHMKRELVMLTRFVEDVETLAPCTVNEHDQIVFPNTKELIRKFYDFNC